MGVFDKFERGIERAVNGAFARAFRSEVQPVEIASALRRELDARSQIVARDRTLAPNAFVVELSQGDHDRLQQWLDSLSEELAQEVVQHAATQRYAFVGPVRIGFDEADDLDTGLFRIRSSTERSPARPAPRVRREAPAAAPAPSPVWFSTAGPAIDGSSSAAPEPDDAPARHPEVNPTTTIDASRPAAAGALELDGRRRLLDQQVTVIGRSPEADLVVEDPGVSRRHVEIHVRDGRARVVDLGSTNGTFLDGARVHAADLADGNVITVGRTTLVYRADAGPEHPPAPGHGA